VPQPFTETVMARPRNPIYVVFLLALFRAGFITIAAYEKFLDTVERSAGFRGPFFGRSRIVKGKLIGTRM
jgi:hypothetical protein